MKIYELPFQFERPVFVRVPFTAFGKKLSAGDEFKWRELGVPEQKAAILYRERYIIHTEVTDHKGSVGDGLDEMDMEELQGIVDLYNKRVKVVAKTQQEYIIKSVKTSKLETKQRGLIRSWRRNFEDWLKRSEQPKG